MGIYKALNQQHFIHKDYCIVPIRFEDRFKIMKWRNEQIYHLRQSKPLTEPDQDQYFKKVISGLFDQEQPNQILFSFLKGADCIGYGGLVHINWIDRNAEISFIMDTKLEENGFQNNWSAFLGLLQEAAFKDLNLHKFYVYAFDLRPHLYSVLEENGFFPDARLKDHCFFEGKYLDVVIYAKLNGEKG